VKVTEVLLNKEADRII